MYKYHHFLSFFFNFVRLNFTNDTWIHSIELQLFKECFYNFLMLRELYHVCASGKMLHICKTVKIIETFLIIQLKYKLTKQISPKNDLFIKKTISNLARNNESADCPWQPSTSTTCAPFTVISAQSSRRHHDEVSDFWRSKMWNLWKKGLT